MFEKDNKSPYVDYEYYKDTYHGTRISQEDFPQFEVGAEAFVNLVTFGRIRRLDEVPDCVKLAICAAAESVHEYMASRRGMESSSSSSSSTGGNTPVKSESNDGYSVTYITYADAVSDSACQNSMLLKVRMYLGGTGLMYRGWSKKYDCQCGHDNIQSCCRC